MLKSGITEEKRYMHMLVSNGKMAELHMKKNKLVRTLGMGFTAIAVAVSVSLSGIRSEAAPSYLKAATYVSNLCFGCLGEQLLELGERSHG